MFFERVKTPGIGHVAYIIADGGTAAIVDPARDVARYLSVLQRNGLRLRFVLETHRQEDFEQGGAALRAHTGAEVVAFEHEFTAHADRRLADGDSLELTPGLAIRGLHTPGHTPESFCYAVTLAEARGRTWGVFTGDALFIGDTGRTDLADSNRTAEHAGLLYDALQAKVLPLGDQALVLPAHGAGSACGGNVADRDHSTIGIERVSNAAATMLRAAFVCHKTRERLARPPYFGRMEKVNLTAGRPFEDAPVPWLQPKEFGRRARDGIVIDARSVEAFAGGHMPGAYNVWLGGMARYGGWIAAEGTPVYLIADGPEAVREARLSLARIGFDEVAGALAGGFDAWRDGGFPIATSGTLSAEALARRGADIAVLDVREVAEHVDEGHIPGARHLYVGHLESRLDSLGLDKDAPVAVTCSVGHRGGLGTSILKRRGYTQAFNLLGGMTAWKALDLPLAKGADVEHAAP